MVHVNSFIYHRNIAVLVNLLKFSLVVKRYCAIKQQTALLYLQIVTHWQPAGPHTICCQQLACWAITTPTTKNAANPASAFFMIIPLLVIVF
jgi:hypothetical protein